MSGRSESDPLIDGDNTQMTEQKSLILTNRFDMMSNFGREAERVLEAVHDFAEDTREAC